MTFTSTRSVEPLTLTASTALDHDDLAAAFTMQTDPDEDLFYKVFGPDWATRAVSEKFFLLARLALLAEQAQAAALNLNAGLPVPKDVGTLAVVNP